MEDREQSQRQPEAVQQQVAPDERRRREERILDAAAALLIRWGYRKTTIDDVAREAGVGKGTIYLHWKDKNQLFRAVLKREQERTSQDVLRRIAEDPDGGLFHRLMTHAMLAALANPLTAAMLKDRADIFNAIIAGYDQQVRDQLLDHFSSFAAQLQSAGLIRTDIPVPVITFLLSAIKIGIINAPDLLGQEHAPSMEQLTEALSDLTRRWLEPEQRRESSAIGKQFIADYLEKARDLG